MGLTTLLCVMLLRVTPVVLSLPVDVVSAVVEPVGVGAGPQLGAASWLSSGPFTWSSSICPSSPTIPSTQRRFASAVVLPLSRVLRGNVLFFYPNFLLDTFSRLYCDVSVGDEHQETSDQNWKTSRPVSQLPQSGQRQLGPTWVL